MRPFALGVLSFLAVSAASPLPFVGVPFKSSPATVDTAVRELGYTPLGGTEGIPATADDRIYAGRFGGYRSLLAARFGPAGTLEKIALSINPNTRDDRVTGRIVSILVSEVRRAYGEPSNGTDARTGVVWHRKDHQGTAVIRIDDTGIVRVALESDDWPSEAKRRLR